MTKNLEKKRGTRPKPATGPPKGAKEIKATGAHYTPPELARFLADLALEEVGAERVVTVLDPACGDGSLLLAIAARASENPGQRIQAVAIDQDPDSVDATRAALASASPETRTVTTTGDFLQLATESFASPGELHFKEAESGSLERVDVIIANPPYVRTQVLGASESRRLAKMLGLTGRVDLYHAFVRAMAMSLNPGGTLALLCSNRFLTTLSGQAVRHTLQSEFTLRHIIDLGDTKLFGAAVLPAIVIATKGKATGAVPCRFARVYEVDSGQVLGEKEESLPAVLEALSLRQSGLARESGRIFRIEEGTLSTDNGHGHSWTLTSRSSESWLSQVGKKTACTFGDVGKIRVGIKTTADKVFIRSDWHDLHSSEQPEPELLQPLVTHKVARRWRFEDPDRSVLYPHTTRKGKKAAVQIADFPRAKAYLETHRERLEGRKYVIEAGRQWYEIWVPQVPALWSSPRIVWPDISETPRFALDRSGAIVNGDCYWLTLHDDREEEWLYLMLGVANSEFALRFYDTVCGNRLYAGRRRYITQYVSQFPLPDINAIPSQRIIEKVNSILTRKSAPCDEDQAEVDRLVWSAFGFGEKSTR